MRLEALVRWDHLRLGWVSPPDLIAAPAMAGLTESQLCYILKRDRALMQILRSRGLKTIQVSMNVSPRENGAGSGGRDRHRATEPP